MTKEDATKIIDVLGLVYRLVECREKGCIKFDTKHTQDELHRLANELRKDTGIPVVK